MAAARRAITPATLVRYSIVPRLSSIGLQARRTAWSSAASAASLSLRPTSAVAASETSTAVGATAPSTTRASMQTPAASSVTLTPAPTTAMADHRTGGRGPDDEGAVLLANIRDAGNFLGVDDQFRLGPPGTKLNQQIGPAGQDLRNAGRSGEDANGLLDRRRC